MVVVHPLKERIGLDLLHACSTDPVLLLTAEPAHNMCSLNIKHVQQLSTNHLSSLVLLENVNKTSTATDVGTEACSYLRMRSLAFSDIGTSGGKVSVSRQFITFLYVS